METLFAVLHVALAVFIVGPLAAIPHLALGAVRKRNAPLVRQISTLTAVFTYASAAVFLLGFAAMAFDSHHPSFGSLWIWLSVVLFLAAFALGVFVLVPSQRSAAVAIEAAPTATERPATYPAIAATSGVVSVLLIAIVVLMIARP